MQNGFFCRAGYKMSSAIIFKRDDRIAMLRDLGNVNYKMAALVEIATAFNTLWYFKTNAILNKSKQRACSRSIKPSLSLTPPTKNQTS